MGNFEFILNLIKTVVIVPTFVQSNGVCFSWFIDACVHTIPWICVTLALSLAVSKGLWAFRINFATTILHLLRAVFSHALDRAEKGWSFWSSHAWLIALVSVSTSQNFFSHFVSWGSNLPNLAAILIISCLVVACFLRT